jgi:hypothetical protein
MSWSFELALHYRDREGERLNGNLDALPPFRTVL